MIIKPEALKWYGIILLLWFVLTVLPLALGIYDDLSAFLGNKFKTLFNGKDSMEDRDDSQSTGSKERSVKDP